MKVIIAGSRQISDYKTVMKFIESSGFHITEVVSGGAKGPDTLGEVYAEYNEIPYTRFIPDWDGLGKKAGILRNVEMGNYADGLIAIWDGASKGTKHMIDYMHELEKPVKVLVYIR